MSYTLKLTPVAIEDIEFFRRSGDKATLNVNFNSIIYHHFS